MNLPFLLVLALLPTLTVLAQSLPPSPKRPVVDTYFGKAVVDNYRWLEDLTSPQTKDWLKAQADYTNAVLNGIPGRDSLINTVARYDNPLALYYGEVKKRGDTYFYRKTLPGERIGKLYLRQGPQGPETLLFDPATYEQGKKHRMTVFTPSSDGKKMAIGVDEGGSELATIRVMNVATRTFGPESITAVVGREVSWLPDNSGFLYRPNNSMDPTDPKGNLDTKARLHKLGTNPSQDPDLFSRTKYPDLGIQPEHYPFMFYSDDQTQVYGYLVTLDHRTRAWVAPATEVGKPTIGWKRLCAVTDSVYDFVKLGKRLFLHSVKGAPYGRILVTDAANPNPATATVLWPQGPQTIKGISTSKDFLFVTFSDGINETIRQYDSRTNQWADVPLAGTGRVSIEFYDAPRSNEVSLYSESWNDPGTLYDYNPETRNLITSPFHVPTTYPGLADVVVEEVAIPGHDGTIVPLSIIYRKGLKRDGGAACLMQGYGAFGVSGKPSFSPWNLALLNQGVVLAETHPRGGSEKGESWHKAGYKTTKPNTWKDFIASGEYLIQKGYTSTGKLIGMGSSAGGILIGRAITERPDLFAAAISNVSNSNALRAEHSPNGRVGVAEFGTVTDSTECMALYEMDAVHHVQEGVKYPAVICVGGMNDGRVVVWQPAKFAAALQNASTSGRPVLMQVNYADGHLASSRTMANMLAFGLWQAGHPAFQPGHSSRKR